MNEWEAMVDLVWQEWGIGEEKEYGGETIVGVWIDLLREWDNYTRRYVAEDWATTPPGRTRDDMIRKLFADHYNEAVTTMQGIGDVKRVWEGKLMMLAALYNIERLGEWHMLEGWDIGRA